MTHPKPISGELGEKQQQAIDGPYGPPMQKFDCEGCGRTHFDTGSYFYGIPSTRCIWCRKFPKPTVRKDK